MPRNLIDELEAQEAAPAAPQQRDLFAPSDSPITQGILESALDTILQTPNALIRGGNRVQQTINEALAATPLGQTGADFVVGESPATSEGVLDIPSGRQILSALDAGAEPIIRGTLGAPPVEGRRLFDIPEHFPSALESRTAVAEENPDAFGLGNLLGQGVGLLAGRSPSLTAGAKTSDILAPKIGEQLSKVFKPETSDRLSRLFGRSAEAGFEGAFLALQEEGSPLEAAAWASGSQAAGLIGLKFAETAGVADIAKGRFLRGGGKLMGTALAMGGLIQFAKTAVPGGDDFLIESIETGFDKVIPMLVVGAAAGMTGAGRVGNTVPFFRGEVPVQVMDAMTTIPRGAMLGFMTEYLENEEVRALADRFTESPESLTQEQRERVQRAFEKGTLKDIAPDIASEGRVLF